MTLRTIALAGSTLGLASLILVSTPALAPAMTDASPRAASTPVVAMCEGEEDHQVDTSARREPDAIVLECDAYGPQYGNPNTEYLDRLSWVSWGRKKAVGYGMFTYGPPYLCPPNPPGCTGGPLATLIAKVVLTDPKPFGPGGRRTTFTKVTVTVSAVPDQPFGKQVFTYTPSRWAYPTER